MSLANSTIDHTTLNWVKQEIDESLNQARHALEDYVENPDDVTQLRFCITHMHQVYGTLQMVELYGASLFAEEMEQLATAILNDKVSEKDVAYEILMRSILQLPDYLEKVQGGLKDDPLILLPLLNDMRAACGDKLLSETALFSPDLSDDNPIVIDVRAEELATADIKQLAGKLRHNYQLGLLGWLRDSDEANLATIDNVFSQLEQASHNDEMLRLWWIARAVVRSLMDGGLEVSAALKSMLGNLDREIRGIIEHGEEPGKTVGELTRNLLYYVGISTSQAERVNEVKARFNLADLLMQKEDLESAREQIAAPNMAMMGSVVNAIKEDLLKVKDELDLALRSEDRRSDGLGAQVEVLTKIADTLGMLGEGASRKIIQAQTDIIREVLTGGRGFTEALLMEIASSLLHVESLLDVIGKSSVAPFGGLEFSASSDVSGGHSLALAEMHDIQATVLQEVLSDMVKLKDSFISFIDAPWDYAELEGVPQIVDRARGGVQMLSMDHVARLIGMVGQYLYRELLDKRLQPTQVDLDSFADAIIGIEYYIESLLESRSNGGSALALAQASLERLGYSVAATEEDELRQDADIASDLSVAEISCDAGEVMDTQRHDASSEMDLVEHGVPDFDLGESGLIVDAAEPVVDEPHGVVINMADALYQKIADEVQPDVEMSPTVMDVASAPTIDDEVDDDLDEDILDIFMEEANEELEVIKDLFPQWCENTGDHESLGRMRRAFHTIKGSGRMVGADQIGDYAWSLENMLNRILDNTIHVNNDIITAIDKSIALMPAMVAGLQNGSLPGDDIQALIDRAFELCDTKKAALLQESEDSVGVEVIAEADSVDGIAAPVQMESEDVMDAALYDVFTKESLAHLDDVHQFIDACRREQERCAVTDSLVRALHTLHGSARMASANGVAEISGLLEKYTKTLMGNSSELPAEGMEVLEKGVYFIEGMLADLNHAAPTPDYSGLMEKMQGLYAVEQERAEERLRHEHIDTAGVHTGDYDEQLEFDEELVEVFLEEGLEILDNSEALLKRWSQAPDDKDAITELQRELHTLKGGARMAGIASIGDLSHGIESLLEAIVDGQVQGSPIELMHRVLDHLYGMLQQTQQRMTVAPATGLLEELDRIRGGEVIEVVTEVGAETAQPEVAEEYAADNVQEVETDISSTAQEIVLEEQQEQEPVISPVAAEAAESSLEVAAASRQAPEPAQIFELPLPQQHIAPLRVSPVQEVAHKEASAEMVRVSADLLDDLVNHAGEVSIYSSRIEQQVSAFSFNLVELEQTITRLRSQLRNMEMETEAQVLFRHEREGDIVDDDFDPLEMDRYSTMQQLSRALMESTSDISSIQGMLGNLVRESETLLIQQSRVNTELQEGLMRTRMVAFSGLVPRMRRLVRQTANELGKKVELNLVGEHGEMDRTLLERITAPLEHMLRNAISHGIESPRQRKTAGKPAAGVVTISIFREAGDVVIQLEDDGAGMDLEAIRAKAIDQGLMDKDARLSDHDVLQFVLESGFSTAQKVTQVSGRGVGMDVVSSEVKQLGGSMYIDSVRHQGARITLRLPFTLAVNQALLFGVGEENYAVPLNSIEGIVRMTPKELEHYLEDPEARYFYVNNEYQVQSLSSMLGAGSRQVPAGIKMFPVLLIKSGEHRAAIQVERLMGSREIVVKSVGPQISTVRGISGATILGNGDVVLILDIGSIIRMGSLLANEMASEMESEQAGVVQRDRPLVMVVDDSITVRKVTSRLLGRNNMDVITAKDGVDAVTILQEQLPDVMLLDIEMPRMDGFELATYMRNESRLKNIPIIMITSRTGEKHRKRAEAIGVSGYLGKPYQENELLENIQSQLDRNK